HIRSTLLALWVSFRCETAALVLRLTTSSVVPGWAASKAVLKGSVKSRGNEVTTVTVSAKARADDITSAAAVALRVKILFIDSSSLVRFFFPVFVKWITAETGRVSSARGNYA